MGTNSRYRGSTVKKKGNSKMKIYVSLATLVLIGAGFAYWKTQNKDESIVLYQETKAQRADITVEVQSTGIVQPQNRLEIKPPIPGRVERILTDEGDFVEKGQILAWMSSTERAALIDSARARGADEVKKWEKIYRETPILAPISGMIIQKNVEPGQTFTSVDAVLVISDRLTVKAQVDETDIAAVKVGQRANITLDAYSSDSFPALVDKIAYDAQTVNNVTTYTVDVLPEQAPQYMRSGMTASVTFVVAEKKQVLAVPNEAIKSNRGSFYVMIPNPDPKQKPAELSIEVGAKDNRFTEILSGLEEDQVILTEDLRSPGSSVSSGSPFSPFKTSRKR